MLFRSPYPHLYSWDPIPAAAASVIFDASDADLILKSSYDVEFHIHKLIIFLVSVNHLCNVLVESDADIVSPWAHWLRCVIQLKMSILETFQSSVEMKKIISKFFGQAYPLPRDGSSSHVFHWHCTWIEKSRYQSIESPCD